MLRFVVEKKSQRSSLPSFQKSGVSNSAFTASFLQKTSLIFIHSAQAAFTAGTRAHHRLFLSLQSFARMMFKKKKNTLLLFLSFFLSLLTPARA